jgi:hypothetical protein
MGTDGKMRRKGAESFQVAHGPRALVILKRKGSTEPKEHEENVPTLGRKAWRR